MKPFWPLLTGRRTERHLPDLFAALRAMKYDDALSLELKPAARRAR
jgi:hypothetical protein